jgi:ADP-heptose:LPS heptosyltransferase
MIKIKNTMGYFGIYMERFLKNNIVRPLSRIILKNKQTRLPIDVSNINKILIIRNDRIGDMIVTIPIIRELKKLKPDLFIGVLASRNNSIIAETSRDIDMIHTFSANPIRLAGLIRRIRKLKYDIVINFVFTDMTLRGLFVNIIAHKSIKIGQGLDKYKHYYNALLSHHRHRDPMVVLLRNMINSTFGIDIPLSALGYEINIDRQSTDRINGFLEIRGIARRGESSGINERYLVFNVSVRDYKRCFSFQQINAILNHLEKYNSFKTVVIYAPEDKNVIGLKKTLKENRRLMVYPEEGEASLIDIASLVQGSIGVITPDTSIVHFASAFKTPVLGFYGTLLHEWAPFNVHSRMILAEEGKSVSDIQEGKLIDGITEFIESIGIKSER